MKRTIIYLILICFTKRALSQALLDTVTTRYKQESGISGKEKVLDDYLNSLKIPTTEKINLLFKLYDKFREQKDATGMGYTQYLTSGCFLSLGDYTNSLKCQIAGLKNFEEARDSTGIITSMLGIEDSYMYSKNFDQALEYCQKSILVAKLMDNKLLYAFALNATADCLIKMKKADSALAYAQEAVRIGYDRHDTVNLVYFISTLGQAYLERKDYDVAKSFLKQSSHYANQFDNYRAMAFNDNDVSRIFFEKTLYDSTIAYAREAVLYARNNDELALLDGYTWIYKAFDRKDKQDSSAKYFRLAMGIKDSLYSVEKFKSMQSLNFQEQIRQRGIEAERQKAVEERKENIQYALIAIGVMIFILCFLLLSRSFITNARLIQLGGVVALLFVFEFFNLVLHPFLERITHHSPVLMLLSLVAIAAIIVPVHHALEKWAIHRMVEKNKLIRLAAAKKTIEELEDKTEVPDEKV